MVDIQKIVCRLHTDLMKQKGIDKESCPEMEVRPRNGITSESIISLLMDIEDELGIELDDYFPQIRQCKTIGLLIEVIEKAYESQH